MTDLTPIRRRLELRAHEARRRRQAMVVANPDFARFVDSLRAVFGPDCRVRWIKWPDGTEEGRRFPGVAVRPSLHAPKVKRA